MCKDELRPKRMGWRDLSPLPQPPTLYFADLQPDLFSTMELNVLLTQAPGQLKEETRGQSCCRPCCRPRSCMSCLGLGGGAERGAPEGAGTWQVQLLLLSKKVRYQRMVPIAPRGHHQCPQDLELHTQKYSCCFGYVFQISPQGAQWPTPTPNCANKLGETVTLATVKSTQTNPPLPPSDTQVLWVSAPL